MKKARVGKGCSRRSYPRMNRLLALLGTVLLASLPAQAQRVGTVDVARFERARVLKAAAQYLKEEPITITASRSNRSAGGPHDFFSEGDYWWPDPQNPDGPYVQRDGMTNPDNFTDHRKYLMRLSVQVPALAAAWKLTGDRRYAEHAARHLRAWFLGEKTRMNPSLLYAQAIKGRFTGRGIGIIDTIHLVEVARAVEVLEGSRALKPAELAGVKRWFADYLKWMTTHQYGIDEREARNNHGTCWVMQAAAYAHLTGDRETLNYCRSRFKSVLVPNQMALDGSFPQELRRTKPYGYSLFNLEAMAVICRILSTPGDNLWTFELPDGRGMKKALAYMAPYVRDKKGWPLKPDVMYYDEWPMRQTSLLFAGLALGRPDYVELWKRLPADSAVEEVVRNFFIRQPVLWVESTEGIKPAGVGNGARASGSSRLLGWPLPGTEIISLSFSNSLNCRNMGDMEDIGEDRGLKERFRSLYGAEARVYRAPGRVNLIGEHTDYNDGFVMPAAIDFYTWVAAAPRVDRLLTVRSENVSESVEFDLDEAEPQRRGDWSDYPRGVALMLERAGHKLRGADLLVRGEVPIGSGLSSSAAIEVATAYALSETAGAQVDRVELALLCQRAENEFVGMRCGIMDQFVSCFGRSGHALMLDCRSLDYRLLPLPAEARLIICNTMVKHELASSEYNTRRAECEEGVRRLARKLPGVRALRDVTLEDLERFKEELPEVVYRRARHIVSENGRVLDAAEALSRGDLQTFGRLMYESHRSLRDDFEVSSAELDVMVELARGGPGLYGARMTGGGFGGCTINLVRAESADEFRERIAEGYEKATGLVPEIYVSSPAQGVGEVV